MGLKPAQMKPFKKAVLCILAFSLLSAHSSFAGTIPSIEIEVAAPEAGLTPPADYYTGADWPEGQVAITFDDGPHPEYTLKVLDLLRSYGVHATFFMVGQMAEWHPDAAREVLKEGHTIGTHSYQHPMIPSMSLQAGMFEIDHGIAAVTQILGQKPAPFFRFPFLSSSPADRAAVAKQGLTAIGWNGLYEGSNLAPVNGHLKHGVLVTHDLQKDILTTLPVILKQMEQYGYTAVLLVPPKETATH